MRILAMVQIPKALPGVNCSSNATNCSSTCLFLQMPHEWQVYGGDTNGLDFFRERRPTTKLMHMPRPPRSTTVPSRYCSMQEHVRHGLVVLNIGACPSWFIVSRRDARDWWILGGFKWNTFRPTYPSSIVN